MDDFEFKERRGEAKFDNGVVVPEAGADFEEKNDYRTKFFQDKQPVAKSPALNQPVLDLATFKELMKTGRLEFDDMSIRERDTWLSQFGPNVSYMVNIYNDVVANKLPSLKGLQAYDENSKQIMDKNGQPATADVQDLHMFFNRYGKLVAFRMSNFNEEALLLKNKDTGTDEPRIITGNDRYIILADSYVELSRYPNLRPLAKQITEVANAMIKSAKEAEKEN